MLLDLRTVLLVSLVISLVLLVQTFVMYRKNKTHVQASVYWLLAYLFISIGMLFFMFMYYWPALFLLIVANLSVLTSTVFLLFAALLSSGRKIRLRLLLLILVGLSAVFIFLHAEPLFRSLYISICILLASLYASYSLYYPVDRSFRPLNRSVSSMFFLIALLHAGRLVAVLAFDRQRTSFFPGPVWEPLYFILLICFLCSLCLSYIATVNSIKSEDMERHINRNKTLLRELRHRTKNNLSLINSLVSLQAASIQDPQAHEAFSNLSKRLGTISSVYNLLSRDDDQSMGTAELVSYMESVIEGIEDTLPYDYHIRISLEVCEDVEIDVSRLVPLGLIVNELTLNAVKYAYPETKSGPVRIQLYKAGSTLTLLVEDEGIGYNKEHAARAASGLGLNLVEALSDQLRGRFSMEVPETGGTRCLLTFAIDS